MVGCHEQPRPVGSSGLTIYFIRLPNTPIKKLNVNIVGWKSVSFIVNVVCPLFLGKPRKVAKDDSQDYSNSYYL
jgi:uncharacterized membrane protein